MPKDNSLVDDELEETYTLQDFNADPKVPHPTILLVGKRFAGKSTASVAIANQYNAPRWAAWAGTKDTGDYWGERFGSSATVWGPDEKGKIALLRIIQFQERKVRLYKKIIKKEFPKTFTIGLVFDDVTSKRQFRRGEILEDLFSNGRHYKSIIIISCQYIKQLPPAVRTNTDYLFMLHNTKRTCKILYEEYVENPDEFAMFLNLLRIVTSQVDSSGKDMYNALVYNNCIKTYKLDEMFQVFRHTENFTINDVDLGCPDWRSYNKAHYKDEEWEDELRRYRKKRRISRLQEHRKKQENRKHRGEGTLSFDLDYFSDSSESEEDPIDRYKVRSKRGKAFNLCMPNTRRESTEDEKMTPRMDGTSNDDNVKINLLVNEDTINNNCGSNNVSTSSSQLFSNYNPFETSKSKQNEHMDPGRVGHRNVQSEFGHYSHSTTNNHDPQKHHQSAYTHKHQDTKQGQHNSYQQNNQQQNSYQSQKQQYSQQQRQYSQQHQMQHHQQNIPSTNSWDATKEFIQQNSISTEPKKRLSLYDLL